MQARERPPRQFKQMQISDLPLRPKGNFINKFKTTQVITNYHRVNIGEYKEIYIYSFDCQPQISFDNRLFRNKLIKAGFQKLQQKIGIPIISGRNLYSIKKPAHMQNVKTQPKVELGGNQEPTPIKKKNYPEINVLVTCQDKQYKIILKLVKTVNLADIMSSDKSKSVVSLNFLNNLMKNLMRMLGFMQIGKSKKFFDARYKVKIPNTNLLMYSGYSTSFSILSTGIYLKVDTACKLVRTQTVLTYINNLYTFHKDKDKTEKRNIVVKEMIGKTVMANYGNSRYWRIQDIVFDNNTDDFIIDKQTNENLTEYYKKRYNLQILSKKQPLVKAKFQQKDTNFAILVPQFLLMTGIPQDFDEKLRRDISQNTSKTPEVRLNKIQDLMDRLNNQLGQDSSPLNIAEKLKITIEPDLAKIQARCLGNPTLLLGQHNAVQENKCASFQLFNKPIYQASTPMRIKVVHFAHYDPRNILNLCQSTANNLKLNMRIESYNLGQFNAKRSLGDIIDILQSKEFDKYNMVTLLLPTSLKTHYKKIKRIAVLSKQINTQVVLQSTLNKKGFASICTKILLQISAKTGNILWVPQPPSALSKRTMIIGVDLSSDKQVSGRVAVGFAASMDENFSRYYSTTFFQQKGIQIIQKMKQLILKAISQYVKYNNQAPDEIIVLRDGCGEGQLRSVKQIQVQNVLDSIRKADITIKPALTFIVIDRKVSQKFFLARNGSIGNPYYGTLINESVVSKYYDFYMIAQNCNRGTVTPTYYKVIYTDSKIQEGVLQYFLYSQCFNYMNWTGSIRVPAVVQYARKLSTFVAQYINDRSESDGLSKLLYYI